eukprot:GEMP01068420.1.p1 GENE.GEMP01068420.1~~GEMP01068420.1.p1  ORF type:complete len:238 (+),score=66.88 GEMP01068420.1:239-952(+)
MKTLYVAEANAKRVVSFRLFEDFNGLHADAQKTVAADVAALGVACDGMGNVFMSTTDGKLLQVNPHSDTPKLLYTAEALPQLSTPRSLYADAFDLWWTNGALGTDAPGTVVSTPSTVPDSVFPPHIAAKNIAASGGVCASGKTLFYTEETGTKLFSVGKAGGVPEEITDKLSDPRGCVVIDDIIYVANYGKDELVMVSGSSTRAVANVDKPFGVAVFLAGAASLSCSVMFVLLLAFI